MRRLSLNAKREVTRLQLNQSKDSPFFRLAQARIDEADKASKAVKAVYDAAKNAVAPVCAALALLKGSISYCLLRVEQDDPQSVSNNYLGRFAAQVANVKQLALQDVPWAEKVIELIQADEKAEESKAFGRALGRIREIEKKLEEDMVELEVQLKELE